MADDRFDSDHPTPKMQSENFIDPLGANDPTRTSDDEPDDTEYEIQPLKSADIDAVLAANRKEYENAKTGRLEATANGEDLEVEHKDLFVTVDNPEKHTTTMESYITFRVTTKTTRAEFEGGEHQVRRRFNDFLWLRQRVEDSQPTHLIPPLPEKHSLRRLERFNPEFVKTRMAALNKFCQRLADHPVLSFNKYFITFLTAKQWEFQAAKKEGAGFMSRWADSFHNISASYMMKNRHPEYGAMNDYIHTFSDKLGVLDRISQRILKERYEYLGEINEYGPIFTLWSNSEDKLAQALGAVAKGVEKSFLSLQELVDTSEQDFTNPLKEYMLYSESVKNVLRRRDAIQMEYEMTQDELNKKKEERDQIVDEDMTEAKMQRRIKLSKQMSELESTDATPLTIRGMRKDPETVRQERHDKLSLEIKELTKQVEVLNDKMVCANADLKADMERWHKNKRRDFRELFSDMADRQIRYYERCLKSWEDTIPLISRTDYTPGGSEHMSDRLSDTGTFHEDENEEGASNSRDAAGHQNSLPSAVSQDLQEHQSDAGAQSDSGNVDNPDGEPSNSDPESLQNINSSDH